MGFKYEDLLNMSWIEYDYYSVGYFRRLERGWDNTRHIIASMYNSSGFSKKNVNVKDIMKLPSLDRTTKFKKVDQKSLDKMIKYIDKDGKNSK